MNTNKLSPKILLGTGTVLGTLSELYGISTDIKITEPAKSAPAKFAQSKPLDKSNIPLF